jgi:hypothetical protein
MTKDEALKLALEALENCVATCFDQYAHHQVMSRPEHFVNQAITALRQAIEQAEQYNATSDRVLMENAQGDLERVKLVQTGVGIGKPEQEPVAFSCLRCVTQKKCAVYGCSPNTWPSETPPPHQPEQAEKQEPVAWIEHHKAGDNLVWDEPHKGTPLYTSPPPRQPEQAQPVTLPEKIYEFVPTPGPIKWHHPECEGQCIACLIEQVVQEAYGSQGLGYLQRHLAAPPPRQPLTDEQLEKGRDQTFSINNPFCPCDSKTFRKVARWVEVAHGIKGEA